MPKPQTKKHYQITIPADENRPGVYSFELDLLHCLKQIKNQADCYHLDLSEIPLDNYDLQKVCQCLSKTKTKVLTLNCDKIDDNGLDQLIENIKKTDVNKINFINQDISDKYIQQLNQLQIITRIKSNKYTAKKDLKSRKLVYSINGKLKTPANKRNKKPQTKFNSPKSRLTTQYDNFLSIQNKRTFKSRLKQIFCCFNPVKMGI